MSRRDPRTAEEWQEAVDAAAACRAIADCGVYGPIEGGPKIDFARCDEILWRGATRGVHPSASWKDLVVGFVRAWNGSLDAPDGADAKKEE